MKSIPAIYENGVFRPKSPVNLPAGSDVEVIVHDGRDPKSFGIMPAEDADEMQRIIDEEFGKVNPDDWR